MKSILVIAKHNPAEALRVAAGLSLLHSPTLRVLGIGAWPDTAAVREQHELVEFIEIPCEALTDPAEVPRACRRGSGAG
jgi:hypothetical protein